MRPWPFSIVVRCGGKIRLRQQSAALLQHRGLVGPSPDHIVCAPILNQVLHSGRLSMKGIGCHDDTIQRYFTQQFWSARNLIGLIRDAHLANDALSAMHKCGKKVDMAVAHTLAIDGYGGSGPLS